MAVHPKDLRLSIDVEDDWHEDRIFLTRQALPRTITLHVEHDTNKITAVEMNGVRFKPHCQTLRRMRAQLVNEYGLTPDEARCWYVYRDHEYKYPFCVGPHGQLRFKHTFAELERAYQLDLFYSMETNVPHNMDPSLYIWHKYIEKTYCLEGVCWVSQPVFVGPQRAVLVLNTHSRVAIDQPDPDRPMDYTMYAAIHFDVSWFFVQVQYRDGKVCSYIMDGLTANEFTDDDVEEGDGNIIYEIWDSNMINWVMETHNPYICPKDCYTIHTEKKHMPTQWLPHMPNPCSITWDPHHRQFKCQGDFSFLGSSLIFRPLTLMQHLAHITSVNGSESHETPEEWLMGPGV